MAAQDNNPIPPSVQRAVYDFVLYGDDLSDSSIDLFVAQYNGKSYSSKIPDAVAAVRSQRAQIDLEISERGSSSWGKLVELVKSGDLALAD